MGCLFVLALPIGTIYYLSEGNIGSAILCGILSFIAYKFFFGGDSTVKKLKTQTETRNGKQVKMVLMKYIGYETYTTAFGNKKRRRVWKTKWVKEEDYLKHKHKPLVSRPWEARFFD